MSFIYLSTPYSHSRSEVRERRYMLACQATAKIVERQQAVFCPIVHSHRLVADGHLPPDKISHYHWKLQNLSLLRVCSELWTVQFEGYAKSKGMAWEISMAGKIGIPIQYWKPSDFGLPIE